MAFPTTSLLDDFNRADGAPGANWDAFQLAIAGNELASVSGFGIGDWVGDSFGADQEVWCTITDLGDTDQSVGMYARATGGGSYIVKYHVNGNQIILEEFNAGALDSWAVPGGWGAGSKLGLECIGTTIAVYYDTGGGWTLLGSVTDATNTSGAIGVILDGSAPTIDDVGGGTVAADAASTGTADVTLDAATSTASGSVALSGQASVSASPATLAATGAVAVSGSASPTAAAALLTGTGVVSLAGAAAPTLAPAALSAAGGVALAGAAAPTTAAATLAATALLVSRPVVASVTGSPGGSEIVTVGGWATVTGSFL